MIVELSECVAAKAFECRSAAFKKKMKKRERDRCAV